MSPQDTTYTDTAHLLRRAGFGAAPDEIAAAAQRGIAATTDRLLNPESVADPIDDQQVLEQLLELVPDEQRTNKFGVEFLPLQVAKMWWAYRMLVTNRPLVEKMTLFWHGHFTSKDGEQQGQDMVDQNQLFRQNALGNFRALTLAVSRNTEMLRYLNGNQNFKAHPNENYGRELMELYTCGIGHYTEDDVKAAARAFSGWNLRRGQFYFNERQHDDTEKTFLGKTGNWNGDDIVDMLVAHPATARRLCTQLFTYFAYPDPEPAVLDALVKTYYSSGYDIRAILGQIFRSQAFYSDSARFALIKCPVQYAIGTVKMMGLTGQFGVTADADAAVGTAMTPAAPAGATMLQRLQNRRLVGLAYLPNAMRQMGQDLFSPPSVKGWDGNEAWINSATMLARIDFANVISRSRRSFGGAFVTAVQYLAANNLNTEGWVDYLASTLGPLPISRNTRQLLISYAGGTSQDAPWVVARTEEGRLRGVIPLLMATPEYQVC